MFSTWRRGNGQLLTSLPPYAGRQVRGLVGWNGIIFSEEAGEPLAALIAYYEAVQRESCGRCVPCRIGTHVIGNLLKKLAAGDDPATRARLRRVAELLANGAKCELGQGAARPVLDFLAHYEELAGYGRGNGKELPEYRSFVAAPCRHRCPAHLDVPAYVEGINEGRFAEALAVIRESTALAGVLGRVCVHPCEEHCRRGLVDEPVAIRSLKRFAADYELNRGRRPDLGGNGESAAGAVAIIGAGPAGLSCAYQLARRGYKVTVFEALPVPGGMLAAGIPAYRLPRDILEGEIEAIRRLGVEIKCNVKVGEDVSLAELRQAYAAVFLAVGLHESQSLGVEGEAQGYEGFVPGVKYLRSVNLGLPLPQGKRIAIIGGGNVAMDCARSSLRLGYAEVHLIYRRSRAEMPANVEEIEAAEAEGVRFHFLANPTRIVAENGRVRGLECIRMQLGEPDASGRRRPVPVPGSEFFLPCEVVVPAVGQVADLSFRKGVEGLEVSRQGTIVVDPQTLATSLPGVFAGGDIVLGARTVVEAVAQGNRAALSIDQYLRTGRLEPVAEDQLSALLDALGLFDPQEQVGLPGGRPRRQEQVAPVSERLQDFREVELGLTYAAARAEAARCLRCYRVGLMVL